MQEVMGYVPAWIVRWGIMVLVLVMLALVAGGLRYPDVIEAEMRLTSRNSVTEVVAHTSGKVSSLYVFKMLNYTRTFLKMSICIFLCYPALYIIMSFLKNITPAGNLKNMG